MHWILPVAVLLHACFMLAELFPWSNPLLLGLVSKDKLKPPDGSPFTPTQQRMVAAIVHNAGIYNGIVAGGLLWAACGGVSMDVARVMFIGAVAAGIFGALTLSWKTSIQAVVGILGLIFLRTA